MNSNEPTNFDELLRERAQLLQTLTQLSSLLKGSFFERYSTCSRPNCRCHSGHKHGPRSYLVIGQNKTQRQLYIRRDVAHSVRIGVDQYRRLLEIAERVTAINLELLKAGLFGESAEASEHSSNRSGNEEHEDVRRSLPEQADS